MPDIHLTRELLRAVARGELPPRTLVELGFEHLTALCPACREEWLAWRREQDRSITYDSAFQVLPTLLVEQGRRAEAAEKAAARDFQTLLGLPHQARLTKIDRATRRFRGPALASLFLRESKRHIPLDYQRAGECAETAEAVLRHTPQGPGVADLSALAAAYLACTARKFGDFQAAHRRFALARHIIKHQGVTDSLVIAEIDSAEATLHVDQRRFHEAEDLLVRSIALYALAGERERAAEPLLTLSGMYYYQGKLAKALEATKSAAEYTSPERDLRLYVSARFNQAVYLCEAGDYHAAADALLADRHLLKQFPDLFTRLVWVEGRIAAAFGELEQAERAFRQVRDAFLIQKLGYDAALASLDLALVYAQQQRPAELKGLAEEMHAVFAAGDVHREAAAALLLFEQAGRQERLTAAFIEQLVDYLKRARLNPALRFKPAQ